MENKKRKKKKKNLRIQRQRRMLLFLILILIIVITIIVVKTSRDKESKQVYAQQNQIQNLYENEENEVLVVNVEENKVTQIKTEEPQKDTSKDKNKDKNTGKTTYKLEVNCEQNVVNEYTKDENGQYLVTDSAFQIVGDGSQLMQAFSFQDGDVVRIPDYSSEVIGKTTNSLPTYEITCSSNNCLKFNIVPFAAEAAPEFRFNIENIKNETYISQQQTIN